VGLRFALEAVSLNLDQAIPCGLILNELVSNALKYAFPGDRSGEISVALNSDKNERVTLRITDDGVGIPPVSNRGPTLGMSIVNILMRQLGGTLIRDDAHGVDISLVFQKAAESFPIPLPTKTSRVAV
jgi:two-component sensor histidine kinase